MAKDNYTIGPNKTNNRTSRMAHILQSKLNLKKIEFSTTTRTGYNSESFIRPFYFKNRTAVIKVRFVPVAQDKPEAGIITMRE